MFKNGYNNNFHKFLPPPFIPRYILHVFPVLFCDHPSYIRRMQRSKNGIKILGASKIFQKVHLRGSKFPLPICRPGPGEVHEGRGPWALDPGPTEAGERGDL